MAYFSYCDLINILKMHNNTVWVFWGHSAFEVVSLEFIVHIGMRLKCSFFAVISYKLASFRSKQMKWRFYKDNINTENVKCVCFLLPHYRKTVCDAIRPRRKNYEGVQRILKLI